MNIGLVALDSKTPNLALMKLSTYYKSQGHSIILNPKPDARVDKIHCSVLFTWSKDEALALQEQFPDVPIEYGGTGWDLTTTLPDHIEQLPPDYDLYTAGQLAPFITGTRSGEARLLKAQTLVDGGIGFTSRGCVRSCPFCCVPAKEGRHHHVAEIAELLNPRSNVLTLLDANLTADPNCVEKLNEMRDRKLEVNITQGMDARLMTDDIAHALSQVKMWEKDRLIHLAWDLMQYEEPVLRGLRTLAKYVPARRLRVFMLIGYNTTFEEDMYRFRKLREIGAYPYAMVYNRDLQKMTGELDLRVMHFARWATSPRIFKQCSFDLYDRWLNVKDMYMAGLTQYRHRPLAKQYREAAVQAA